MQVESVTNGQSQSQQVKRLENHLAHTEYYGWDGDRLVFCNDLTDQWHYLYEPESFTPMLLIRLDSDPELDECQHIIQHNMSLFKDALSMMDADDAEHARTQMRAQLINTLKQQGLWQEPKLPKDYYFYHCNHLGLPDALTDKTGQVVWAAEYDPWGNLTTEHNPHNLKQNIRLPGQYHDTETGLYYNRHRYYDPKLGSYINQDPIGLNSGEPNFYAYPKNPVQGMDPLGLWGSFVSAPGIQERASLGMHMMQQGASPSEINQALYGSPTGFKGALSAEVNISGHVIGGGDGAVGLTIGKDREDCVPKLCVYFTSCQTLGPGASGGIGISGSVSNSPPTSGVTYHGGVFGSGGLLGKGGFSVLTDLSDMSKNSVSGGVGIGGGSSGGLMTCQQHTKCIPDF